MFDHLLYSQYQTTYFECMIYKENLHIDKLAGAERVNKFVHLALITN